MLRSESVRTAWDTSTLLLALALTACGGAEALDTGTPDAGPAGVLEVGTGVVDFVPLDPATPTALTAGPQASGRYDGYHIWTSLRLTDVAVDTLATYTVRVRTADAQLVTELIRDADRAPFEEDTKGRWVLSGLAPRLSDCCLVSGATFLLEAEVVDTAGNSWFDRVEGVAGACPECP